MAYLRFRRATRQSRPSPSSSAAPPPAASLSLSSRDARRSPLALGPGMRGGCRAKVWGLRAGVDDMSVAGDVPARLSAVSLWGPGSGPHRGELVPVQLG